MNPANNPGAGVGAITGPSPATLSAMSSMVRPRPPQPHISTMQHSEATKRVSAISGSIYIFYYKMQGLVEAFFKRMLEAMEEQRAHPERDRLAAAYEAAYERLVLVVKDAEIIMSEVATKVFPIVKDVSRLEPRSRDIQSCALPGITEPDKIRNVQHVFASIR